jgi:hypothetical protein
MTAEKPDHPTIPALKALIERIAEKEPVLEQMARESSSFRESTRLKGKCEGLALARSYAEEALKEARS